MSLASAVLKLIRFVTFSVVAVFFTFIFAVSLGERDLVGARIIGIACLLAAIASAWIGMTAFGPAPKVVTGQSIEELEKQGIIVSSDHEALRAIAIEEFEDEGSCYLLELRDGSILCLRGQYLYDYEARENPEDPTGPPLVRRFPNARFQLKKHVETDCIWDVVCLGEPFEPLYTVPAISFREYESDEILLDGEISTDLTFDQLIVSKGRLPKSSAKV